MAGNLAGESSREAATRQQELQRVAARGRREAEAEAAAERQELLVETERLRAELRDAQAEAARNALAVRNTLDLERRAAPFPFHRQELQRSAARGRQEAEAGFARERQELLAETERLRAELQDARGDVATVRALAASGDVAAARNARRFAEAEAARNALAAQAAAAQQRADHAFTEAETSRNALAAQATQVNTLLARVQQQNSRIADLENLDRESWAALQMGVVGDGGNVVLSPGVAALVHFAMPGNPCLPISPGRPRGSSQLFPRPGGTDFPYAFSAEIEWLQREWSHTAAHRQAAPRFELTRIVVEDNPELRNLFIRNIARNEGLRARGTNPAMLPDFESVDADDQRIKESVLGRLQMCFLARMGLRSENLLLAFHGASHSRVDDICEGGFMQLNYRNNGFFGQGLYTTTYPEHACMYGTGQKHGRANPPNAEGEFVVLACLASPGRTYPITRRTDYAQPDDPHSSSIYYSPPGQPAAALKNQFQSHYVYIGDNSQCETNELLAPYDELVLQNPAQLLPAYRLYYRPVPAPAPVPL